MHAHVMRGQCKDSKKGGGGAYARVRAHTQRADSIGQQVTRHVCQYIIGTWPAYGIGGARTWCRLYVF